MKRSELKRTGFKQKKRRPMRQSSPTNSKPNEGLALRWKYAATHPTCLLCGNPTEQVHHIRRGCHRADRWGNLAALCFGCHMLDGHGKDDAVLTIRCLFAKVKLREFSEAEWNEIGTPYLAGWLSSHEQPAGEIETMRQRLIAVCSGSGD